ncbi:MAG: hypothetical protein K9I59_02485 [Chlorobium sp.]|uniref:hypothetical protein n=1 Tax=Chlorobium sp. TaxID=1095 RepID=UPI0025B98AB8|nr:hypothetical protein [Chlorobium sp.]MCF8215720.1 hypothetical protein [Chlorobium sp.]MCF8270546.1 hypothetical protein [Chlorobium sp.]MCF8286929.1 hypothetical protein [Chlorobium sp.]MCF8290525.1 hypothetical protein [Chlorobium sp.]MCF8384611.1 hypothetical protein [Chlorobium sp.]
MIVLLTMPLGHAAVIFLQHVSGKDQVVSAGLLLVICGTALVLSGLYISRDLIATFFGLFGGLFVWAGWVEIGFEYHARQSGIEPLMQNAEVVNKPEYLLMPSSVGFFAVIMLYYLFGIRTGCRFFLWFQRLVRIEKSMESVRIPRNTAMVTFMEFIVLLWGFYLLLLFAYDVQFAGDRHPFTYFIAFGSLLWSVLLFANLLKIARLDYAVRYAIPTVVIFWNFIEILGRWNVFTEIWIEPSDYRVEIALMGLVLVILTLSVLPGEKGMQQTDQQ